MKLLVVNAGSSTLRYSLVDSDRQSAIVSDTIDTNRDVSAGLRQMLTCLREVPVPDAIGHRVVHGGRSLSEPVLVDSEVVAAIAAASGYAPLHNPATLEAIEACRDAWPDVPQVAVFDTGFHASLPEQAYSYALPADLVERYGLRRFGFHGISHEQLMLDTAAYLGQPSSELNLITLHLGNGASATAIEKGRSVDTSMGMTPAQGLVMGTRCGDIDPGLLAHVMRHEGLNAEEIDALINTQSGLLGLCGDFDMRAVRRRALDGDIAAQRAIDIYVYRIRKYVGAYLAVLGRVDALVFSGGIGEHNPWLVEEVLRNLAIPGLELSALVPAAPALPVNLAASSSSVAVLVLAADETRAIVRQMLPLLER